MKAEIFTAHTPNTGAMAKYEVKLMYKIASRSHPQPTYMFVWPVFGAVKTLKRNRFISLNI